MKGIVSMSPVDFRIEYCPKTPSSPPDHQGLYVVSREDALQIERGPAASAGSLPKQQVGFLNQSIDEISRLYVASPFSW